MTSYSRQIVTTLFASALTEKTLRFDFLAIFLAVGSLSLLLLKEGSFCRFWWNRGESS